LSGPRPVPGPPLLTAGVRVPDHLRTLLLAVLCLTTVVISLCGCSDDGTCPKSLPSFPLGADLDGNRYETGQFRGKILLVDFWTRWAKYSPSQLAILDTLRVQYVGQIQVVAVSWRESPASVNRFLAEHPQQFPVTLDPDGTVMEAITRPTVFPAVVLFDPQGKVCFEQAGYLAGEPALRMAVRELLGAP
jgi:hypothetical protein